MERVRVTTHHTDGSSDTTYLHSASGLPDADGVAQFAPPSGSFWAETRVDAWRARLAHPRVRAAVLTGAALVFGLGWLFWSTGTKGGTASGDGGARAGAASSAPTSAGRGSSAPATTGPARISVHVAGAVAHPGVVTVAAGSRVVDAIVATGGAIANADLTHINLAAPLVDGAQVLVLHVGDPGAGGLILPPGVGGGSAPSGPVNLNTATVADLDALPGIGPSRAQEIVREREQHGPYRSVDDLQRIKGLGAARIAALRDRVTV